MINYMSLITPKKYSKKTDTFCACLLLFTWIISKDDKSSKRQGKPFLSRLYQAVVFEPGRFLPSRLYGQADRLPAGFRRCKVIVFAFNIWNKQQNHYQDPQRDALQWGFRTLSTFTKHPIGGPGMTGMMCPFIRCRNWYLQKIRNSWVQLLDCWPTSTWDVHTSGWFGTLCCFVCLCFCFVCRFV